MATSSFNIGDLNSDIAALNSNLAQRNALSELTYNTSALTWVQCTRSQAGKIVAYQCSVTTKTALGENAKLASGFSGNIGSFTYGSDCIAVDDNKGIYHIYMTGSGDVYCIESVASGRILRFTLVITV